MQTIREHTHSIEIFKMINNTNSMSVFLFYHNLLEILKNIGEKILCSWYHSPLGGTTVKQNY